MTSEELKEIEERYNVSRGFFQIAMKDIVGMGITSHKDVPRLLAYIKELESQIPRWIPVKERLPEESGYYLCWDIGAIESAIPYAESYYFDKERRGFEPDADLCITHWQPLPKGPEE